MCLISIRRIFKRLLTILALVLAVPSFAQERYTVTGVTVDSVLQTGLSDVTIAVLDAQDSILQDFTYTQENGSFQITGLQSGDYLLLVSYPDYAEYVSLFTLTDEAPEHDFAEISMKSNAVLLEEVVIKARQPMIIKGDTLEFDASFYVIQPNDKVEDLLRKLSGISVDQNGKITAYNETVSTVLLDGEEFFGDDPTLITRNIRADMVDKVQLYDRKSDQATFTGIDDGVRQKTINIKLKEDKKNGAFGRLNAGSGTDEYYEAQAMYNRFKNDQKYAVFGTVANNGTMGLSSAESSRIGASNVRVNSAGLSSFSETGDLKSYAGSFNGQGFPATLNGGAHYDNKWDDGRHYINGDYLIGQIDLDDRTTVIEQRHLPDGRMDMESSNGSNNRFFSQKFNSEYRLTIDTSASLKVNFVGALNEFRVNEAYRAASQDGDARMINDQERAVENEGNQDALNISAYYAKRFPKPRRTISVYLFKGHDRYKTDGNLYSSINFYDLQGVSDSTAVLNQRKTIDITNSSYIGEVNYTEPLAENLTLQMSYTVGIHDSDADRYSYDLFDNAEGSPDSVFTSRYRYHKFDHKPGARLNYQKDKSYFSLGGNVNFADLKQENEFDGSSLRRKFVDWNPRLNYFYNFSQQRSLDFTYNGHSTQPRIEQLQTVNGNADPLNIIIGNPDLDPSFTNSFDLTYRLNNPLTRNSAYVSLEYSRVENAIASNWEIDETSGKSTIGFLNVHDRSPQRYSIFADVGGYIKPADLQWSIFFEGERELSYDFVNSVMNELDAQSYRLSLSFNKSKQDRYSLAAGAGPTYTVNETSLQPELDNNASGFHAYGRTQFFLPWNLQLNSDIRYEYASETDIFDAEERAIWNASVSKTFLKGDQLKFSLSVNDILDQNKVFSRSAASSIIRQSASASIRRYFMLSVTWDFNSFAMVPQTN